ncbi:hypothetical protein M5K25_010868 [Dendrobium thyrsiflorum]|uniref:Uncharacterized protein n=1 Tax=Dendrobium thyrsiflorum TaxID=117978 RepID=A0ABD0V167_DENTH
MVFVQLRTQRLARLLPSRQQMWTLSFKVLGMKSILGKDTENRARGRPTDSSPVDGHREQSTGEANRARERPTGSSPADEHREQSTGEANRQQPSRHTRGKQPPREKEKPREEQEENSRLPCLHQPSNWILANHRTSTEFSTFGYLSNEQHCKHHLSPSGVPRIACNLPPLNTPLMSKSEGPQGNLDPDSKANKANQSLRRWGRKGGRRGAKEAGLLHLKLIHLRLAVHLNDEGNNEDKEGRTCDPRGSASAS